MNISLDTLDPNKYFLMTRRDGFNKYVGIIIIVVIISFSFSFFLG